MSETSLLPSPLYKGKIRSLYPAGENALLMYTSDRISAFDVVFSETVPEKGVILKQISCDWCKALEEAKLYQKYSVCSHLLATEAKDFPAPYSKMQEKYFLERSVYIRQTQRIDFECIVRGYLAGSAWKEYKESQSSTEITKLPPGLSAGAKLLTPIFTPSTKATIGDHDENVSYAQMEAVLGEALSSRLRDTSLAIYNFAAQKMEACGILLADTKFEFGLYEGELFLIDEVLTPDSSRYWLKSEYIANPKQIPSGFDKQHIRDYAEQSGWNKKAPAPPLPEHIIQKTKQVYREIHHIIQKALK